MLPKNNVKNARNSLQVSFLNGIDVYSYCVAKKQLYNVHVCLAATSWAWVIQINRVRQEIDSIHTSVSPHIVGQWTAWNSAAVQSLHDNRKRGCSTHSVSAQRLAWCALPEAPIYLHLWSCWHAGDDIDSSAARAAAANDHSLRAFNHNSHFATVRHGRR